MNWSRTSVLAFILILALTACTSDGDTDTEENGTEPDPPPQEQPTKEEPDADKVLSQAINKMEGLKNYTITTNMNQHIQLGDDDDLSNKYRSTTAVNLNPVHYHETASIIMDTTKQEEDSVHPIRLERYLTDKGVYIYDSSEGRWVKFPEEFTDDFQSFDKSFENPSHLLELIEAYSEELHIKEGNDHYRITFTGSDEQMQEIALEMTRMVNTEFSSSMKDLMYVTGIERLQFELDIDKETYDAKKLKMDLQMTASQENGEPYQSSHTVVARFSLLNETKEVTIPPEVLQTATEMELEEFSGFKDMKELETIEGIKIEDYYKEAEEEAGKDHNDTNEANDASNNE
ncbi:DUF6612 family protein [Bacillus piscicola]|uniref:DUF6612 family protein n=1 Tax=Bacillus piscicola TaxID=1632684 RepID=UPI001F08A52D|nr:DUF6612 family protein [Bacillus piscicola]